MEVDDSKKKTKKKEIQKQKLRKNLKNYITKMQKIKKSRSSFNIPFNNN